ncbi:hypothetical protein CDEST_14063 [Colletotrichum destructivum]|uniref:Uncharacterized protein n=1 Tax=Colletotrichum destructivum TaxID=34406 RepID=A0AAX4J0H4_9PEZI|nr:hypothetical protein CDEST_14063 [Colletotrichum destructivum]
MDWGLSPPHLPIAGCNNIGHFLFRRPHSLLPYLFQTSIPTTEDVNEQQASISETRYPTPPGLGPHIETRAGALRKQPLANALTHVRAASPHHHRQQNLTLARRKDRSTGIAVVVETVTSTDVQVAVNRWPSTGGRQQVAVNRWPVDCFGSSLIG